MKKLLLLIATISFLAVSCNQSPPAANNDTNPAPTTVSSKVDAAVNLLNASLDSEDEVQMQTDSDLVNSDQSIINSYSGVSNESSY